MDDLFYFGDQDIAIDAEFLIFDFFFVHFILL